MASVTQAITPTQRFPAGNGQRAYGDQVLHDVGAFDSLDAAEILATSSNVASTRVFDALGLARFTASLRRLRFGEALPSQIPRAAHGSIPALSDERSFDAAVFAIGEMMAASPLHVAAAYGAIANEGVYQAPTLVRRAQGEGGRGAAPEVAAAALAP